MEAKLLKTVFVGRHSSSHEMSSLAHLREGEPGLVELTVTWRGLLVADWQRSLGLPLDGLVSVLYIPALTSMLSHLRTVVK